jgi:hypothetical protein
LQKFGISLKPLGPLPASAEDELRSQLLQTGIKGTDPQLPRVGLLIQRVNDVVHLVILLGTGSQDEIATLADLREAVNIHFVQVEAGHARGHQFRHHFANPAAVGHPHRFRHPESFRLAGLANHRAAVRGKGEHAVDLVGQLSIATAGNSSLVDSQAGPKCSSVKGLTEGMTGASA